ncbi:MAG: hypothetical protein DI616_07405 [Paracoccus denitrificans]|uniref:Uncharacterized protein n=1 Tax=Paracoccus denitrificans TaxID=266 RepID=A0A533I9N4_PARDE|nr:MAG: hypothetical protein DI616_07405 [Paracoccus denitrificans]
MFSDIIFGLFLLAMFGISPGGQPRATVAAAPDAPDDVISLAVDQLECLTEPDPTPVLRAMMNHGLIHADERIDTETFSCFPIPGGISLGGINANSVCGGVVDEAIADANPDLYQRSSQTNYDDGYEPTFPK